jgi:predicted ArsR family transcriptional regulator
VQGRVRRSTRLDILHLLRDHEASVETLSRELGVTPNAVRQHLAALEADGLLRAVARPSRHGRPHFVYSLTESAAELFPGRYEELCALILNEVMEMDGQAKVEELLHRVAARRIQPTPRPMTPTQRTAMLRALYHLNGHSGDEA